MTGRKIGREIVQESVHAADVYHLRRELGTKLDSARTRERVMELEIAMIDKQGLTLPPAASPMHPPKRESHLSWRRKDLDYLRREQA